MAGRPLQDMPVTLSTTEFTAGASPMPADIKFNESKCADGEAAFQRGVSLTAILKDVAVLTQRDPKATKSDKARESEREADANGILVGYFGAALQAVRRIDAALMGGKS